MPPTLSPERYEAAGGSGPVARSRDVLRAPLFGAALAIVGFLLLLWPFVSSPAIGIGAAYLFMFGTWISVIVVLAAMARALRPSPPRARDGDD
jgi:hypothetical protein